MHSKRLARLVTAIDAINDWVGRGVAWLTLAMVLVTILVVTLRYQFRIGFVWMQESVVWMHALVFMLGAAYTLKRDEHVRVDVYYRKIGPRGRAVVDLLGTLLLLLPVCVFLFVASFDYVVQSWQIHEASREAGGLAGIFLLKSLIPLMALALALQGLAEAARAVLALMAGGDAPAAPAGPAAL